MLLCSEGGVFRHNTLSDAPELSIERLAEAVFWCDPNVWYLEEKVLKGRKAMIKASCMRQAHIPDHHAEYHDSMRS